MDSSVHANSPMLCSFRVSFIGEFSENDFKDIPKCVPLVVLAYISVTTAKYLDLNDGIYTSDFKELMNRYHEDRDVVIKGPSGCGKTYALVSLFAICVMKQIPCVLFSSISFGTDNPDISSYYKYHMDQISGEISTNQHSHTENDVLISLGNESKQFIVFLDFSKFHSDDSDGAKRLVQAASGLAIFGHKLVVSVSSGVEISDAYNASGLRNFLSRKSFLKLEFKGFTYTEALTFVKGRNCKNITLKSIQYFCGTNPFLLSQIDGKSQQSVACIKGIVKEIVKNYFTKHVKGLTKDGDTLESYFMREEMLRCSEFVNDASMEVTLTGDRIRKFEDTFLFKHRLAILDYRETRSKVQEDEDFAASTTQVTAASEQQLPAASEPRKNVNPVLKWNFPIVAEIYKDVINNFIKRNTDQSLKEMCAKVSTFAGYWYECLYFSKIQETKSIKVSYRTMKNDSNAPDELELKFDYSEDIKGYEDALTQGVLYETKAYYPIIDGVGYLKDQRGKLWLVFIQISLSKYEKHRSLCDLFRYTTHVYKNWSLYTYYRWLYKIPHDFKYTLLLYVSPQENSNGDLLPKLKGEISGLTNNHLKQYLNYAVLSSQSLFHNNVKDYFPNYIE